jgi:hypothetical protein
MTGASSPSENIFVCRTLDTALFPTFLRVCVIDSPLQTASTCTETQFSTAAIMR